MLEIQNNSTKVVLNFPFITWPFIHLLFRTWLRWKSPSFPLHLCQARQKGSRCAPKKKRVEPSQIFLYFFQILDLVEPAHQLINCRNPDVQLAEIVWMLHPAKKHIGIFSFHWITPIFSGNPTFYWGWGMWETQIFVKQILQIFCKLLRFILGAVQSLTLNDWSPHGKIFLQHTWTPVHLNYCTFK